MMTDIDIEAIKQRWLDGPCGMCESDKTIRQHTPEEDAVCKQVALKMIREESEMVRRIFDITYDFFDEDLPDDD